MKKQIYSNVSELILALNDISEHMYKNISGQPEFSMKYVLRKIVDITKAKAGNVRFFDKPSKTLVLKASYGVSKKYKKMKRAIDVRTSIAGYVFKHKEVYAAGNLTTDHIYAFPEYALNEGINSLICTPLKTAKKNLGVMSIYFPAFRKFHQEDLNFFSAVGVFLATFINSQILNYQLHESYLNISSNLIRLMEEKDPYTKGHSMRVREYSVKIAQKLGLPQKTIQILENYSILHDIGKISIDNSILNKADKLNSQEWDIIKKHPLIGATMIPPIDGFVLVSPFIKYHHERIDGKGYPEKISGSKIPLLARIIAVADAFDAMTSPRAYKKMLTVEEAKKELIDNAGTQFDEKIVKIMIDLINEGEISPRQSD